MQKKWLVQASIDKRQVENFRSELKVDRIVSELLLQREIASFSEAESFFRPKLDDLHNPFLLLNMDSAVERLNRAIQQGEKILLFGDYDVDGTTAVALLYTVLKLHCIGLDYYIPDRYSEGYGISTQGIDFAAENNFSLIISLDCGIKANDKIAYAKSKGIDFIVCDHHNPGEQLPDCIVLDPKQENCLYPFKELSGCGVGFKLLQALSIQNNWEMDDLMKQLDLVAVSIGADIVQVTGENRILTFHGLKRLNENPRSAFTSLLKIARKSFPLTLTDVVFVIAPRINAAGRLRSGRHSVELMISDQQELIDSIASEIDQDNSNRKELDQQITQEALDLINRDSAFQQRKSTVVFQDSWHKGVVGIVASRLIEKHFRPTIVLTESNGKITGSARTVNDFDIHHALTHCEDLLEQYGGHKHAAGLTMQKEKLNEFVLRFEEIVERFIQHDDRVPQENVDLEISLSEIFTKDENRLKIPRLKRILNQLEPHGPGNMKPVFLSTGLYSVDLRILKDEHLKISVTQPGTDIVIDAIGFGMAEKKDLVAAGVPFDMIYTLETNSWNNRDTLQLMIKDIRPSVI